MNKNINMKLVKTFVIITISIISIGVIVCMIGGSNAKKSALSHAGLSANEVNQIRWEFDFDNFYASYDVEWYYNNMEYDYKIDALSGDILKFEIE